MRNKHFYLIIADIPTQLQKFYKQLFYKLQIYCTLK